MDMLTVRDDALRRAAAPPLLEGYDVRCRSPVMPQGVGVELTFLAWTKPSGAVHNVDQGKQKDDDGDSVSDPIVHRCLPRLRHRGEDRSPVFVPKCPDGTSGTLKRSGPFADIEARKWKALMKSKSINDGVERTFVLILDQGEEAFKSITEFADRESISGASVAAIGAFSEARVGWFDLNARTYKPIEVNEQCEVLSLIGDVAQGDDGKASLHLHAVLGLQDGALRGGHFLSGMVQPTLEVTIRETVVHLRRKKRSDLGIA